MTLGGVELPADTPIILVIGSANRDEKCFVNGETFDIMRDDAKEMMTFGYGVKYCLGAPLAKLEAQIVLEELTARFPSLRLAVDEEVTYRPNSAMRGPERVILEWDENRYTLDFEQCNQDQHQCVGGKCASLGTLIQAEAPVPPGFAVLTEDLQDEYDIARSNIDQLRGLYDGDWISSEDYARRRGIAQSWRGARCRRPAHTP